MQFFLLYYYELYSHKPVTFIKEKEYDDVAHIFVKKLVHDMKLVHDIKDL